MRQELPWRQFMCTSINVHQPSPLNQWQHRIYVGHQKCFSWYEFVFIAEEHVVCVCGGSYVRGLYLHSPTDIKQLNHIPATVWHLFLQVAINNQLPARPSWCFFRALLERREGIQRVFTQEFSVETTQMWPQNTDIQNLCLGGEAATQPAMCSSHRPSKGNFPTPLTKPWDYLYRMCTLQTALILFLRTLDTYMQVKRIPIPRLLSTCHLLSYYKQQQLWWRAGNEAVMEGWEWGCGGGLGMRLWWRTGTL